MSGTAPGDKPDPMTALLSPAMVEIATRSQRLIEHYAQRLFTDDGYQTIDPRVVAKTFQDIVTQALANPMALVNDQIAYWQAMGQLWQRSLAHAWLGTPVAPVAAPTADDKRFKSDLWSQNFVFDFVKQCYLLTGRHVMSALDHVDGVDAHTRDKAKFYARQALAAASPANFALTNPEIIKAAVESNGESLIKGLANLLEDLERGQGRLSLKMTDLDAFTLGENIATTPGKVIYQNELMQLLHYTPTTATVHKVPLLIVPPWINKFYILDLKPKNSFIKWAVDQGFSVFVISWVNPDESLTNKDFADYVHEGTLAALDAIRLATGERKVNAVGYCIGGTLTATTLAYMAAKGDGRIASATLLTTMLDFSDVGELKVFIDEDQMELLDEHMARQGYLEGHHMAEAFNLLRENDLIWSFVIQNYLLGNTPRPFDLLYWNSDSTRMPAAMHRFYLRNMYLNNKLRDPGGISIGDTPIDLRSVKVPVYFLSAREDHIALWRSTYAGTQLLGGANRFVLGASGHIAGVVNPPDAKKYGHWTNDSLPPDPDAWLAGAQYHEGSWWTDWRSWLAEKSGPQIPARQPGAGKLKVIEAAPGSYVRVRLV